MKFVGEHAIVGVDVVTLRARVWVEINLPADNRHRKEMVTLRARVWVEIFLET